MRGTLVFDHLNDIVYLNCCSKFVQHVARLATAQGLVASEHSTPHGRGNKQIDPNILVQLFSPLVTSQRFMREQFGNPYNSVQCEDGTNIVFQEFMGFLFMRIGSEEIAYLRRALGITITFVSFLCGPDVALLKSSPEQAELVDNLLTTWGKLYTSDQSFMIEAVEQLNVNPQINATLIKSLRDFSTKLQNQLGSNSVHALIFMETKLLSWYSTRGAIQLGSVDILFLTLLCQKICSASSGSGNSDAGQAGGRRRTRGNVSGSTASDSVDLGTSSSETGSIGFHSSRENLFDEGSSADDEQEELISGDGSSFLKILKSDQSVYVPQIVHISVIQHGIYAVFVCEPSSSPTTTALCTALQMAVEFHGKYREPLTDKPIFDQMEGLNKKILDLLKKQKNLHIRAEVSSRWDRFRSGFQQYLKTKDQLTVQTTPMVDVYREAFRNYYSWGVDKGKLGQFWDGVKTNDFWSLFSTSFNLDVRNNLSKYLEDFPGLVHFVYVDRNRHIVTTPSFDYRRDDSVKLTKTKIWGMVKFAREHMQQGHFSLMWKDTAFNYAYFLWFEDMTATPIRGKQLAMPWEGYPMPGILCGDFYKRVVLDCFPGTPSSKIRCLELFCIHLGLVTSSCVLEHSKRLATNISDEVAGNNPAADLL
ncbi:Hermansky-Pudlak syndrome 1 protein [Orchesella cincta]|uniref:Hermansky-Pudlak syndrome 1 protein n=1 Tax=Orchesella cincta TaxID=48709 RepID=A0A1D2MVD0_ORCCI|nr:Hermansky-Pudlak syndrome 1 protein [Orchesella cincta]